MSQTAAVIGKGTTIGFGVDGATAPGTYVNFAEVVKVGPPKQSAAEVKATHYLSPANSHEFLPGWLTGGEVSVEANYINADLITLQGLLGVMKWFSIAIIEGAHTIVFRGFLKALDGDFPNETVCQTKFSIKISGAVTIN